MKKIIILLLAITVFTNCKKETKKEVVNPNDGLTLLKGAFVYYADAAVLKTNSEIYNVILNEKVDQINKQAIPFKKEDTDFVLVEVRGIISPKPKGEEGWDNNFEIKKIIRVAALKTKEKSTVTLDKK